MDAAAAAAAATGGAAWCAAQSIDWPDCPAQFTAALAVTVLDAGAAGAIFLTGLGVPDGRHAYLLDQLKQWHDRTRLVQVENDLASGNERGFHVVGDVVYQKIVASQSLRGCQIDSARATKAYFTKRKARCGTIVLPTGCGKSGVIACLPYVIGERNVLIITPRKTIRGQLFLDLQGDMLDKDKSKHHIPFLLKHTLVPEKGLPSCEEVTDGLQLKAGAAKQRQITVSNAAMFMKDSAEAKKKHWSDVFDSDACGLVIVDEAHHFPSTLWDNIVKHFSEAKVVFLTATPYRSNGDKVCTQDEIIYMLSFGQAVNQGYIRDIAPVPVRTDPTRNHNQEVEETARVLAVLRYVQARLQEKNQKYLLPPCKKLQAPRHQAIAVANSVEQATHISELAAVLGLKAHVYYNQLSEEVVAKTAAGKIAYDSDGKEQKEKKKLTGKVLKQFEKQEFDLIIVMHMLGEGYDHPPISVTAFFFAPGRGPKASQFMGRGVRRIDREDKAIMCDVVWHEGIDVAMQFRFKEMRLGNYAAQLDDDDDGAAASSAIKGPLRRRDFSSMSLSDICKLSYEDVLAGTADADYLRFVYFDLLPVSGYQAKTASTKQRDRAFKEWIKAGQDEDKQKEAAERLAGMGKSIHDNDGQGECFYLAVATCFNVISFQGKQTWTWREVKAAALAALASLSRATVESRCLVPVLSGLYPTDVFQSHPIDTDANWQLAWRRLVDDLYGADAKYADQLVLQTLREVYAVNITVFSVLDANHDLPFQTEGYATTIELFHLPEHHYQAVLPADLSAGRLTTAVATASNAPAGAVAPPAAPQSVRGHEYDIAFDPDAMPKKQQKVSKKKGKQAAKAEPLREDDMTDD